MKVTVKQSEVFENLETGTIQERFHFEGAGLTFFCGQGAFEFETCTLKLDRAPDRAITQILLEADAVGAGRLARLATVVPLPVSREELATLHHADLLLQLKPEVLQQEILPRLRTLRDLKGLLELLDAQRLPILINLANYQVADFLGDRS